MFIGVDVGGTTSTICLGDMSGHLLEISPQFATRSFEGPAATIDDIASQIARSLASRELDLSCIKRVTIATPGPATLDGVISGTPNLPIELWNECPVRELLQQRLKEAMLANPNASEGSHADDIEVGYLGDGQAAALGEFAMRRGDISLSPQLGSQCGIEVVENPADIQSLFMVAVGTGLGGGEVRGGKVVQGAAGRAGHAGHIMLPNDVFRYPHDQTLKVGNSYHTVESAVSLTALTHQLPFRLGLPQWANHPLHEVEGSDKDRAKRLRELAAEGDALALELFDDQATALGVALLCLQNIGDYDELVIGGGVCDMSVDMKRRYLKIVKEAFHQRALNGFRDFDAIGFSCCGDQASVIGAYRASLIAYAIG